MTKEQEKAIKVLEKYKKECLDVYKVEIDDTDNIDEPQAFYLKQQIESIDTILNLIQKQDKQIDLMARAIDNYDSQLVINTFKDKEHVKEYFKELAERKSKE